MRVVPLLTATLVLVSLYLFVMQRETLMTWAGVTPGTGLGAEPGSAAAAEAPPPTATDAAADAATADDGVFSVVVQRFVERDLESGILLHGRTAASRQVEVRAQTTGPVISDPVARGSRVTQGQVLCRIDPGTRAANLAQAQAQLSQAQARLVEAQTAYDTATRLSVGGYASQTRVAAADSGREAARAAVEGATAAIAAAQAELDRLVITAPFDGVLESDSAERGSLLAAGGLCATVIQLDPLLVVGYAAEAQINRLAPGARAGAQLSNGTQAAGQVTFLARTSDPATRTFRVEVTVPNPDLAIRAGMSADVVIEATATRGHLIPGSVLTIRDDGVLGVRMVDATDHTVFAPVTVLRDTPQGFWVSGLPREADVIVVGQEYVTDGVAVHPVRRGGE